MRAPSLSCQHARISGLFIVVGRVTQQEKLRELPSILYSKGLPPAALVKNYKVIYITHHHRWDRSSRAFRYLSGKYCSFHEGPNKNRTLEVRERTSTLSHITGAALCRCEEDALVHHPPPTMLARLGPSPAPVSCCRVFFFNWSPTNGLEYTPYCCPSPITMDGAVRLAPSRPIRNTRAT